MNEEQNMDFDFGSAIEKIQEMMGTDDGQSKLNNIINAFVGSDEDNANSQEQDSPFPDMDQMDMMIKLGNVMSAMKTTGNSKNAALLYALKPYLRESRQEKMDSAVKIMGMVKAFALLKDSDLNLNF